MRRLSLIATTVLSCAVSLIAAGSAQAVVVDMTQANSGQSTVPYTASDSNFGVSMVPGTASTLQSAGVPVATPTGSCLDPSLTADFAQPTAGLCWNQGPVMHANETFALTWDPARMYWQNTRNYVEQFLRNVADSSGTLSSPFAVTTQYFDGSAAGQTSYADGVSFPAGHAAGNRSSFGGGCIDYGVQGNSSCDWANVSGTGAGHNYTGTFPDPSCPVTGTNQWAEDQGGAWGPAANQYCVTDAQIRDELTAMIRQTQVYNRFQSGETPLFVILTPPGTVTCLDSGGALCSDNSTAAAKFCSYHGTDTVTGVGAGQYNYVVQPWSASWTTNLGCDEPDASTIPNPFDVTKIAAQVGERLVSPLSRSEIASIVNPYLAGPNAPGWYAQSGAEIDDNGCAPLGNNLDNVTINGTAYNLQREFNNGGLLETDPNALRCIDWVNLTPAFVVPSPVDQGDQVWFDGSATASALIVPGTRFSWNFGDGTTSVGPSVVHAYATGGNYNVTLTVTDRGYNTATLTQAISVLGADGNPVAPGRAQAPAPAPAPSPSPKPSTAPVASLKLMPQSLRSVLRDGLNLKLDSSTAADGIVTVYVSRKTAKLAHLKVGRSATVAVGRGTVSGLIKNGWVTLHLKLNKAMAQRLACFKHLSLTVRLALVAKGGRHFTTDAAGRY